MVTVDASCIVESPIDSIFFSFSVHTLIKGHLLALLSHDDLKIKDTSV